MNAEDLEVTSGKDFSRQNRRTTPLKCRITLRSERSSLASCRVFTAQIVF